jgi:hypothetical protein
MNMTSGCMAIEPTDIVLQEIRELGHELREATEKYRDHSEVIFEALQRELTYWLSRACPCCREHIASQIQHSVPRMLAIAGRRAAVEPSEPKKRSDPTETSEPRSG